MNRPTYSREFLELLDSVTAKRPRNVIQHILDHGRVTTDELKELYRYKHPPRAARDVRELGIPLITDRITDASGRAMAAYRFGDPADVRNAGTSGRTALSAEIKTRLIEKCGAKCNIYLEPFPARELQIDHRVPFEVVGTDAPTDDIDEYMLLCPSANAAKSWSCQNCPNWSVRDASTCRSCYWAFPESYSHVATRDIRRLDIMWTADEAADYDELSDVAARRGADMPEYVKRVLKRHVEGHMDRSVS